MMKTVLIFIKMQREIDKHQIENQRSVRNFIVAPIHSYKRKHVRIDNEAYLRLLQQLKIDPKAQSKAKKGGRKKYKCQLIGL